ncbi:uncharacterized protein BX663DRAFT_55866 [Cokeromyces recurvatus]|uniref:uncharacterized protein n=1 Tax=Cokeromyces recurvatus TaxID=90255 RepID=UPI00221E7167|nr:uncharacterized protein BX663DRAFT_55866 [Cokeromyces recurvatus]KAI7902944.1 hypothetical protein BX663DRAFT_55866 [Cokeromyces recurvatus]
MTQRKLKIISRLGTALSSCCESSTMAILKFSKKKKKKKKKKKLALFILRCFTATKIRIWRAFMPASKIYVTNCICSVEVPTESKTSEEKSRKLIDLF